MSRVGRVISLESYFILNCCNEYHTVCDDFHLSDGFFSAFAQIKILM